MPMPAHRRILVVPVRDAQPAHATSREARFVVPDTSFAPVRPTCQAGDPLPMLREKLPESMPAKCEQGPRPPVGFAVPRFERAPAQFRRKECTNKQSAGPLSQGIGLYPMVTKGRSEVNSEKPYLHQPLGLCYVLPFAPFRWLRLHLAPDTFRGLCPGGSLHGALRVSVHYSSVRLR